MARQLKAQPISAKAHPLDVEVAPLDLTARAFAMAILTSQQAKNKPATATRALPLRTMATMSMMVDSDSVLMDSIPRLRWSPKNNRFHYNMPVAAEPGADGFVLLQEFEHADSLSARQLPAKERHHLEEMERINHLIHDVENSMHLRETVKVLEQKRMHHEEYHERAVNDEEERPQGLRKKDSFRQRQSPKRSFEGRRQKPTRLGRVHQPK